MSAKLDEKKPDSVISNMKIKKRRKRWTLKPHWKTSILRIVKSEGFRLHHDSLDVLENLTDNTVNSICDVMNDLMRHSKKETYSRNTVRLATASAYRAHPKLARYALEFEKECYNTYLNEVKVKKEEKN